MGWVVGHIEHRGQTDIDLSIYLSNYLSIYSIYLSVYLSIYLSTLVLHLPLREVVQDLRSTDPTKESCATVDRTDHTDPAPAT